jgi:predicted acyl esterase
MRLRAVVALAAVALTTFTVAPGDAAKATSFRPRGLSANRFPVVTAPQRVVVKAHDGIELFALVYRPDTKRSPKWKTPVILVHSPYFNAESTASTQHYVDHLVELFTPKGYTVVLSDVRGTGNSGGCLEQDGVNQAKDFATLVEHFGTQSWSNGRVGSYGKSYDGETQHAGAVLAPKHLKTIVPVAAISSMYDTYAFDGVPYITPEATNISYHQISLTPSEDRVAFARHLPERHLCQVDNHVNTVDPRATNNAYWAARDFRPRVKNVRASVLYVMGFADVNVLPINIDGWYDQLPTFKRAIFGQWKHNYPYAENPFTGAESAGGFGREDWFPMVHAWFDHELLGLKTGVERWPAVQVQDEDAQWHPARSFADLSTPRRLALADGGVLGGTVRGEQPGTWREDTSAAWTTKPYPGGLRLSGQVRLDVTISLDRPDAHFAVGVYEVDSDGDETLLTRGYLSAQHARSLAAPALVEIGQPARYRIRTLPFDATLDVGSSLRVRLAGFDDSTQPAGTAYTATLDTAKSYVTIPVARDRGLLDVVVD